MSDWERLAEQRIREAQRAGEFDDLPGEGQPLSGLDQPYDALWWVKALARREGLPPDNPALALRREIERELESTADIRDEARVRARIEAVNLRIERANATTIAGPATGLGAVDVDRFLERWRQARRRRT